MRFLTAVHTDIGLKKSTNQDSALIMEAMTDEGNILLTVICDGMGGLAKGEVASSTVIQAFSRWFENNLKKLIKLSDPKDRIFSDWEKIVYSVNSRIARYASENHCSMGTTLNATLFMKQKYYIINIGDSRAYRISNSLKLLTKDQTYVQREIDMGRMTPEEAMVSPQRSVLLQCVGASEFIDPDFFTGDVAPNQVFLQCSDGFRHVITEEEIYQYCNPSAVSSEQNMLDNAVYLTELNKYRRETDNITVILTKTTE